MNEIALDDVAAAAHAESMRSGIASLRAALVGGVAMLALAASAGAAEAAMWERYPVIHPYVFGPAGPSHNSVRRPGRTGAEKVSVKETSKPLSVPIIAVSIASQRLTVYDKGVAVASAPVSTGTPGHPTPTGIFSVIQKQKVHFSNLYNAAPMPYMQRITWSGVALHAGPLPGFAASHGCIRMPRDFAVRLWSMTRMGARVIVSRGNVAPQEFSHPHLFVLKKAQEMSRVDGAGIVVAEGNGRASDAAPAAQPVSNVTAPATQITAGPEPLGLPELRTGSVTSDLVKAADAPLDSAKSAEPEQLGLPELRTAVKPAPVGTPAETKAEPPKPADPADTLAPKLADKPLRSGPVSVFVSRKAGRLYVRKGFEPVFDMPVTIARADAAIGTHVFTANELQDDGSFRWLVVSMQGSTPRAIEDRRDARKSASDRAARAAKPAPVPPVTAAEALDRVEFPAEAVERISQMMSAGASLIISDKGLGSETGKETDFIVLTR